MTDKRELIEREAIWYVVLTMLSDTMVNLAFSRGTDCEEYAVVNRVWSRVAEEWKEAYRAI